MFGLFNCRPYSTGFEYEWFYFYFYLSWSWQLLIIKVSRCDTCLCCTHISQAWIVSCMIDMAIFFLPVIGDRHGRIRLSHLAFGCGNIQATLITIGNSDRSFTSSPTCIFPCLLFFGDLFLHLWWGSEMVLCMEREKMENLDMENNLDVLWTCLGLSLVFSCVSYRWMWLFRSILVYWSKRVFPNEWSQSQDSDGIRKQAAYGCIFLLLMWWNISREFMKLCGCVMIAWFFGFNFLLSCSNFLEIFRFYPPNPYVWIPIAGTLLPIKNRSKTQFSMLELASKTHE